MPPTITGRAIGQGMGQGMSQAIGQGLGKFMDLGLGTEIIYSFVIIVCSLMIYLATKELYELSKHKGIKYFRQSFLFFALAYFFRSFIKIIILYFGKQEIRTIIPVFGNLTLFIFIYFSVMAIFYLLYSVMWKKWKSLVINVFHAAAIIIALVIVLLGNPLNLYLILNLALFIFIVFVVYTAYKDAKKKKSHNLYIIYLLLSVFWIFNILDILVPSVFQNFQLLIYLASSGIFLTCLLYTSPSPRDRS